MKPASAKAAGEVAASPSLRPVRTRKSTATSRFGTGKREGHDASAFYERFTSPEISIDSTVNTTSSVDVLYCHDARDMTHVEDNSVALVVTSPPYFAGKQYEEVLGEAGVPADYFEYLAMLESVFAECKRVLEPGGRIAVNVANLGRRPYRSLSGDVTQILQDLGLLLRGEIIWWKGRAAGGSCAWGTFQRPNNPVLRDVTERVIVASKGRFDRAVPAKERVKTGLPSTATISREEFLESTTDLWEMPPESATRVNHPAPFPVELPQRLIELYTYENDVILDPFMGSGTSAVAAVRTDRHFIGYDTDADYVKRAKKRVKDEQALRKTDETVRVAVPAALGEFIEDRELRAIREGRMVQDVVQISLEDAGFSDIQHDVKVPRTGVEYDMVATDAKGKRWAFDVTGAFTTTRSGLRRVDALWRSLGKAAVVAAAEKPLPLVFLTTELPVKGSAGLASLQQLTGKNKPIAAVLKIGAPETREQLRLFAKSSVKAL
jgi:DNA modification methylase